MAAGADCPCCGQLVKLYKRQISGAMAWALIVLAKSPEGEWVDTTKVFNRYGKRCPSGVVDFTKLRYWGLIEGQSGEREDGSKRIGKWRVTPEGRWFAKNNFAVSKYAHVFNNKVFELSGAQIRIKDCLGNRFNFNELWGNEC